MTAFNPITVDAVRVTRDLYEGTQHEAFLSNGMVCIIQRMSAAEAMGLGGWHVVSAKHGNGTPIQLTGASSWLADNKVDALDELCRIMARYQG